MFGWGLNVVTCVGESWVNCQLEQIWIDTTKMQKCFRFIDAVDLLDSPLLGSSLIWFDLGGNDVSPLDWILLMVDWANTWGYSIQWALNEDISSHCLVVSIIPLSVGGIIHLGFIIIGSNIGTFVGVITRS